jgi:putative tryptophan/tyrosine transport system substrate-binding protein
VDIDYRYAEGDTTRLKPLAQELIAFKPDVAFANSPSPAVAVQSVAPHRAADDREGQARLVTFQQALQQLGWSEGRNMRMDTRWSENDIDRARRYAAELVALAPDVILASGSVSVSALQHVTRTLPIVFAAVGDPVGIGLVDSLARPGGNVTGFMNFEYSLSGKWLELLKQIAPRVTRAAVLRNPAIPAGIGQFSVIQAVAPSLGVDVSPIGVHDLGEIERAVAAFARAADGGLIVTASALASVPRDRIIALAARHKLPAVYSYRYMVTGGGLVSYGPDLVDQFTRAAGYVDRILKGETAANLPVQAPLKTAKQLGLEVPSTLLARADEVIE